MRAILMLFHLAVDDSVNKNSDTHNALLQIITLLGKSISFKFYALIYNDHARIEIMSGSKPQTVYLIYNNLPILKYRFDDLQLQHVDMNDPKAIARMTKYIYTIVALRKTFENLSQP